MQITWNSWQVKRRLNKLGNEIDESPPNTRVDSLHRAIAMLSNDQKHYREEITSLKMLFNRKLSCWWGTTTKEQNDQPFKIKEDCYVSTIYNRAGIACAALEALLALWISKHLGLPLWSGPLVALLLIIIFDGAFSALIFQSDNPKGTLRRVKRWFLLPSIIIFVFSIFILLLVRTVPEDWVRPLLLVFNISLWTTSFSLWILGGALLAAAQVLGWSKRETEEYNFLDFADSETEAVKSHFMRQLQAFQIDKLAAGLQCQSTNEGANKLARETIIPTESLNGNANESKTKQHLVVLMLFGTLSLMASSCGESNSAASPSLTKSENETQACSQLDVIVDNTKSPTEEGLRLAIGNLHRELPMIVQQWNVCRLKGFTFGSDGWGSLDEKFSLLLPPKPVIVNKPISGGGEIVAIPAIRDALQKDHIIQTTKEKEKTELEYQKRIETVLASIKQDILLPSTESPEPSCTDVNGLLGRIVKTSGKTPRLVLLISDGHESCSMRINRIEVPQEDLNLVVALVPEKQGQKRKTSAFDEFKTRTMILSSAIPWLVAIPHFSNELNLAFEEAEKKRKLLAVNPDQ